MVPLLQTSYGFKYDLDQKFKLFLFFLKKAGLNVYWSNESEYRFAYW